MDGHSAAQQAGTGTAQSHQIQGQIDDLIEYDEMRTRADMEPAAGIVSQSFGGREFSVLGPLTHAARGIQASNFPQG